MKKNKLTRNSYKRKIILFAVFIFVSVALISTGFAAWVLSQNTDANTTGNVQVGLVEDNSLKIEITNLNEVENFQYLFEPAKGDRDGRIHLDLNKLDSPYESLELTIKGTISPKAGLAENGLTYVMVIPDGMKKAVEKDFITIPNGAVYQNEYSEATTVGTVVDVTWDEETGVGSFSIELNFGWGDQFGNENPSTYYDTNDTGKNIPLATANKNLEDLRACIYGYLDELDAADGPVARKTVIENHQNDALPIYNVYIKAKAN